jgi:hypothetical protein
MTRRLALAAVLWSLCASSAWAQFLYGGVHPVNPTVGAGFCTTAAAHDHVYPIDPNISYLYRNWNGYNYFVGNPYHFGYQGQAFAYYGNHPLPEYNSYCYLDGTHYHHFLPAASLAGTFVVNNGAYYYNGVFPAAYYSYRPNFYHRQLRYLYAPAYRGYYRGYAAAWRNYATPASVTFFTRRPAFVPLYRSPPRIWGRSHIVVRPVYRPNLQRPNTYNSYNRPVAVVRRNFVRPGGNVIRRTTVVRRGWRR